MNKTILILFLLNSAVIATTINLNNSQCMSFPIPTNYSEIQPGNFSGDLIFDNYTICAPQIYTPPQVNMTLPPGGTATINNFTANCEAWRDTNLTICPIPPEVEMDLDGGQTATINNFTANCKQGNCTCPKTGLENTTINASFGYRFFNPSLNFLMVCPDFPYINDIKVLQPGEISNNSAYKELVMCSNSTAFCPTPNQTQLCTPWVNTTSCANFTSCPSCNLTCPEMSDAGILNCSIKACFCYDELQDLVSFDAFRAGNARKAFNDSKNALLLAKDEAVNKSNIAEQDKNEAKSIAMALQTTSDDNEKLGWGILVILITYIGYHKFVKQPEQKATESEVS